jgi:hypothetical protein
MTGIESDPYAYLAHEEGAFLMVMGLRALTRELLF